MWINFDSRINKTSREKFEKWLGNLLYLQINSKTVRYIANFWKRFSIQIFVPFRSWKANTIKKTFMLMNDLFATNMQRETERMNICKFLRPATNLEF